MTAREISCPRCGNKTVFSPENPFRPFCSDRCKTIDLGDWASESYRIASAGGSIQELAEELEDEESRRESEQES